MAGGTDIASPRFSGLYYINGVLYRDGVPFANPTHLAGERQEDSANGADHVAVAGEWKSVTVVVGGTGDISVSPSPAVVRIIRVRKCTNAGVATANTAGVILVKDGSTVKEAAAAAATAGSTIFDGLDGVIFTTSVILNFASASDDGKIEVLYRPLDSRVSW